MIAAQDCLEPGTVMEQRPKAFNNDHILITFKSESGCSIDLSMPGEPFVSKKGEKKREESKAKENEDYEIIPKNDPYYQEMLE